MVHIDKENDNVIITMDYFEFEDIAPMRKSLLDFLIRTIDSNPFDEVIQKGALNTLVLIRSMELGNTSYDKDKCKGLLIEGIEPLKKGLSTKTINNEAKNKV